MEPSYNYPQDDYALALLTHAAMQTDNTDSDPPAYGIIAPCGLTSTDVQGVLTSSTEFTNQTNDVNRRETSTSKPQGPEAPSQYNNLVLPPSRMETLTFNTNHASRSNPYMDSAFRGIGSEISRNYANNLGILNAESYDDVSRGVHARPVQQSEPVMPFGLIEPRLESDFEAREEKEGPEKEDVLPKRKKRTRTEITSADDDREDGKKKSRGRPRVDTKDETAVDRRRTQIRMAQRAYRNRKETTISSLEKQVQDLRGTNEEMNNIFIALYDFAVGKGVLQREPEFGRQLQSTTERFLSLARSTAEDVNQEENPAEDSEKQERTIQESETGRQKKKGRRSPTKKGRIQTLTPPPPPPPPPLPPASGNSPIWSDFPLDKAKDVVEEIQPGYPSRAYESRNRVEEMQVITRPTEENASFPFDFMDLQQYRVEVPTMEDFSQHFLPQSQPSLPSTYSYSESTFARRLHRGANQRALALITSEHPDPVRFQRVFGFTLMYETKESIIARCRRLVSGSSKDTLSNWRAPFVHVGGAGTHYPYHEGEVNEELMPKLRTGYSMGPFPATVTEIQDEVLEADMRCTVPGFEGEFFDPNDVEGYLRGRGLDIPPAADLVTIQLDFSLLSENSGARSNSTSSVTSVMTTLSPRTPKSGRSIGFENSFTMDPKQAEGDSFPFPTSFSTWDFSEKDASNIEPSFLTMPEQGSTIRTPDITLNDSGPSEKRILTLNVETLIDELISRAVCLGRTPGFRQSDVNAAIVAAAKAGY
ncbi:hypothetical protein G7Y89_g10913 [Cudoniella acicularis]|uniref:BZIP domain-containing protein n=1 Tax=Cudoniella acicularis TaxID=354080 RepID=A0A8H4RCX2_9HELO|nr:hypothetical protein G7Y89_g10913 [Cudoniella acicularis]